MAVKRPPHSLDSGDDRDLAQMRCENVREALLTSARKLFADRGFEGASVKELARAAGHNVAMISYYFGGKEGLYRECVRPLTGASVKHLERKLICPSCQQDFITRFTLFVEEFLLSHLEQEEICNILRQDSHTDVVKKIYKEHLMTAFNHLHSFLKSARRGKLLRSDLDPEFATQIVFGAIFELIAADRMREAIDAKQFLDAKNRSATLRQMTQFLLHGMLVAGALPAPAITSDKV